MEALSASRPGRRSLGCRSAALEAILAPGSLLPGRGYSWRAESDYHIVAITEITPEHVEVHLRTAGDGRLLSVLVQRWGEVDKGTFDYLPFGGDTYEERRFGDLVIPSQLKLGWGYGTDYYAPFFTVTITAATPAG
jgi:hypothetical protein